MYQRCNSAAAVLALATQAKQQQLSVDRIRAGATRDGCDPTEAGGTPEEWQPQLLPKSAVVCERKLRVPKPSFQPVLFAAGASFLTPRLSILCAAPPPLVLGYPALAERPSLVGRRKPPNPKPPLERPPARRSSGGPAKTTGGGCASWGTPRRRCPC